MSDQAHPGTESESDWQAARERLRAYLRALAVADEPRQERVVAAVLQRARARDHAAPSGDSPFALVMREFGELAEQWFGILLSGHERPMVSGFVSLFAIDSARNWPEAFLAGEIPADFYRALRDAEVRGAPDLQVSRMVPQPFANPLENAIKLPAPLEELAKELAPFVSKVFTLAVCSALILPGHL